MTFQITIVGRKLTSRCLLSYLTFYTSQIAHPSICAVPKSLNTESVCSAQTTDHNDGVTMTNAAVSTSLFRKCFRTALSSVLYSAQLRMRTRYLLTHTVAINYIATTINHPVPDWVKPSFVIFDILALWRSGLSVRVPGCQKIQMTA